MPVTAQRYESDAQLDALLDHPQNPRRGDDKAVERSIDTNGWYGAIVAQASTNLILAGHTRRRVLSQAGEQKGPVLWVDCDDETALRILLADNRTAELATWDEAGLLDILQPLDPEALLTMGFVTDDLDVLRRAVDASGARPSDADNEWAAAGMPEYGSEDKTGAYQTTVSFRTLTDAEAFFEKLDRPKAKRIWWPESDGFVGCRSDVEVIAEAQ
jgi:hypothetical protein